MSKIRQLYFYIVSLIGLMMIVIPTADLINLGLKTWVFPKAQEADYYRGPCNAMPIPVKPEGAPETPMTAEQVEARCKEQDEFERMQQAARRQRDIVRDLSFLVVGIPLFAFHFKIVQREKNKE